MTTSLRRTGAAAGFTLIEVLLAIGITAFVMATVGSTFVGILQAREEVRALSESTAAGPRILALMERDLRALWHYNIKDNKVFLGRDRDFAGFPADRMDFLTSTDAIGAVLDSANRPQHPSVCEVGYWLKESTRYPNEFRELWRREDPMVDGDLTTGGTFQLVHGRIKTLDITYYDSLGAKAEPLHDWDSSKEAKLPRRIKIELTLERVVANRNRVSGLEFADFEDTIQKYVRHIVFDERYPTILGGGVAMIPVLPPPPSEAGGAPAGGGPGGGGTNVGSLSTQVTGSGPGGPGAPAGSGMTVEVGRTQQGRRGGQQPGQRGQQPVAPPPGFDLNQLLRGGSGGGSLFGPGGLFGGR